MSKLKFLVSSRANYRGQVNTIYKEKDKFLQYSSEERESATQKLKRLKEELQNLNSEIGLLKWEENSSDERIAEAENKKEITECMGYDDKIAECLIIFQNHSSSAQNPVPITSQLKSPKAPLPEFKSQEGEDFVSFLKQFENTAGHFSYTDYDKFLLLRQQVSGRALALLNSLDCSQHKFSIAKTLLQNALASPSVRKHNVIKQMANLKLDYKKEPFEYFGQINSICNTIKDLSISTDDILEYFAWSGLNENFKSHLVQITNEAKPSLSQIQTKFFEANERYLNSQKQFKSRSMLKENKPKESASLAADIKVNPGSGSIFQTCSLCQKDKNHSIVKCVNYPDPTSKVAQIKTLNGCVKCARMDHTAINCKFSFNRKCNCGAWHFNFLCVTQKPSPEKKKDPKLQKTKETSSNINYIEENCTALEAEDSSKAVLPTFSGNLKGRDIRCLRDGGCQSNFIREDTAKADNLPILKHGIVLKVNGFNSSRTYHTNSYEVILGIGEDSFRIEAIAVPSIKTRLKLPGLTSVVEGFSQRGYKLADQFLADGPDEIKDLDFILGSNSAYCLREQHILFGDFPGNIPSVYSKTPAGVMLIGNVDDILANLKYLPDCHNEIQVSENSNLAKSSENVSYEDVGLQTNQSRFVPNTSTNEPEVQASYAACNEEVHLSLQKAPKSVLNEICCETLNYDKEKFQDVSVETNENIINHVLNNTSRNDEGRLVMPIIWNHKVDHLLGSNKNLATQVLKSNFKKLSKKDNGYLQMIDQNFKEQSELGIIERIDNLDQYLEEHPKHSFLAHMGVFKPDRDTTKCRVVFLSNMCEKNVAGTALTHNQAMLSGPNLNQKITTAILHLRFDSFLLCFDIKKAFLNICLSAQDSSKLLFLWFRNLEKGDCSIVGYRALRLPFGLVCSPCLLLLGLYKILILDTNDDSPELKLLKRQIYAFMYMDNGGITANSSSELKKSVDCLSSIFEPYKFFLQQFTTNDSNLQTEIDRDLAENTPEEVKFLGLQWNRKDDSLATKPLTLDNKANTKRLILTSIASHYDIFGFSGPLINRARLFLHELQCQPDLDWDHVLEENLLHEWRKICKQVNGSPNIYVERFVGRRDGRYTLIAFVDSSKSIYGATIYIKDLDNNKVSFIMAKNKLVNKQLSTKSIPSLEFQAITFGAELLMDVCNELSGSSCLMPINIVDLHLYSDSMVSLSWINSYVHKLDKINKRSVFVLNRLKYLCTLCETRPIKFQFVSGIENPADYITRPISYKTLIKSNYFSGPEFLTTIGDSQRSLDETLSFIVPNPLAKAEEVSAFVVGDADDGTAEGSTWHSNLLIECSSFRKLVSIYQHALRFINNLKLKCNIDIENCRNSDDLSAEAKRIIIRTNQRLHFPEILEYFESKNKAACHIPNLVNQLNIYLDSEGILRVKSKYSLYKGNKTMCFPILLAKDSKLTELIILDIHHKYLHAGCYRLLTELRKQFWVPRFFSVVKRILKGCVLCRKINQPTIKLNQSPYRDFRLDPPQIPFRSIFLDHIGPYFVKDNGEKIKVWILCISCLWTRGINLKICKDLTTKEFLRALQLHCFEYGLPQSIISDHGSSFVAGANIIKDFLKGYDVRSYLEENGMKSFEFDHYAKGCHPLGGLIEICVKMVRNLLRCSIKNYILNFRDFEFAVSQVIHMVNRRPIAFCDALRDGDDSLPDPITPEKLIHGFELTSLNIIPELQGGSDNDPEWLKDSDCITEAQESYEKMKKIRANLYETYHGEFLNTLMKQAVNRKSRYKPVTHHKLEVGDIVLMKEDNCKPINYPMAVVKEVKINSLGEVTEATLMKGNTRENLKRHVTSLIPILSRREMSESTEETIEKRLDLRNEKDKKEDRPKRKTAKESEENIKRLIAEQSL